MESREILAGELTFSAQDAAELEWNNSENDRRSEPAYAFLNGISEFGANFDFPISASLKWSFDYYYDNTSFRHLGSDSFPSISTFLSASVIV
jgi:hypothetical protein